jgi:hypothetical protein
MSISEDYVRELLKLKGPYLFKRESQYLEFKEQFNFAGLADYLRDFAAFANNKGGFIVFGVKNSPRIPIGLSRTSLDQFDKIDPERITGYLLDYFSADIYWEQMIVECYGNQFGVFKISEAEMKPLISKKNDERSIIRNGDIYYRYAGRTQKIRFAELENIIKQRIERNNKYWVDLVSKIGKAGPQNAAVLDTEKALIEKDDSKVLVIDKELAEKLKFIRQGYFKEKEGSPTLKLVGDVTPVENIEVTKRIKENLLKAYPLTAFEMADLIKKEVPQVKRNEIWSAIKDNDIKSNPTYSAYVFRNKKQEDDYQATGIVPVSTPSVYNHNAVDYLVSILKDE